MIRKEQGFSLLEITVSVALFGLVGFAAYSLYEYSKKQTNKSTDEIMDSIARLGASSIIQRDLSTSDLSFNFINIPDNNGLSFFTLAKNQYCRHAKCARELTLQLPEDKNISRPIYFITKKTNLNEVQKVAIHPRSVFDGTIYAGINWRYNSDSYSISRDKFPLTIWEPNRLIVLSSETEFYDCGLSSQLNNSKSCQIECSESGMCDFSIKRPYRFIGVVQPHPSIDLQDIQVPESSNLFIKSFNVCRPDKNGGCATNIQTNLNTPKNFYEKLPYVPGSDDRTSLYNVELVKYHLERVNSDTHLVRTVGQHKGNQITFGNPIKIMSGIKAIVFSRVNVSNPVIEYKFNMYRKNQKLNKEVRQ